MAEEGKKGFYKQWWFWLIVVIVIIALSMGGDDETEPVDEVENSGNQTESTDETENDNNETEEPTEQENEPEETENETDEEAAEKEDEENEENQAAEEEQTQTRDNSTAKETVLNAGTFVVGSDIPAGRYVITGDNSGNLFVYDGEMPVVNEILDPTGEFGVTSVTTDLEDNEEVEISGINSVIFTPAETNMSNRLTTGTWEVGLDIEEGRYDVTTPSGSGNFFVYNSIGLPEVNEILDASGGFGVQKITVNLENGQIIEISGLDEVEFTAK